MSQAFTFDGERIAARPGQSIAAALTEAGHRAFRQTAKGAPRGIFCGMGVCQECRVTVDGLRVLACQTLCRAGMQIERSRYAHAAL